MPRSEAVSIIIPTYNEAENIQTVIENIFTMAKGTRHTISILVVDDNSPDGTGNIVKRLQKSDGRIHLITGAKAGLGAAYLRGFAHTLSKLDPYAIVMMDADMSHDPATIPSLRSSIERGGITSSVHAMYISSSGFLQHLVSLALVR